MAWVVAGRMCGFGRFVEAGMLIVREAAVS